jgi:hypothetical protein
VRIQGPNLTPPERKFRMIHRFASPLVLGAALSLAVPAAAFAQTAPAASASSPIRDEAPVLVSGEQTGPGLWRVAKGGHVMWVLGTQSPLPEHMQWHSRQVEDVLAASQEVIYPPASGISVDGGGFFRSLLLLPKVYGARKNPDGKTLGEVLPPDLYARWLPLRERYLGRGSGAERMRPLFAADELWSKALDDNDLASSGIVWPVITQAIKAHGLRVTVPRRMLKITDAKALLAEVEHAQLDDAQCMEATVRRLEAGPERLRARANAWAVGDIAALRALPDTDQNHACAEAAMQSPALRKRGGAGIDAEVERLWLDAAQKALAGNASTFAVLPIGDLLAADGGYLGRLAALGYEVTAPE